ncbi:MAG: hypothetical protein ACUVXJ_04530 [Phycisphaerae bacterium]
MLVTDKGYHLCLGGATGHRKLPVGLAMRKGIADLHRYVRVSRVACVPRQLKRLHLDGLIARIPRFQRWRVTQKCHALTSAMLILRERYPSMLRNNAA